MPSLFSDALRQHTSLSPPQNYPSYQENLATRPRHLLLPGAQIPLLSPQRVDLDLLEQCSRLSIDISGYNNKIGQPAPSSCLNQYPLIDTCAPSKARAVSVIQTQTLLKDYRQSSHRPHTSSRRQEEKSAGGVAAYLDYEMQQMVDFVAEMVQGMYALYESGICLADIDIIRSVNSRSLVQPAFRRYVLQLLNSTRLPRTTILLGLYYLAARMTMMSASGICSNGNGQIYRMLVTSLLLGSKFLDDNTLKNCSWSEVSNIPIGELNLLEIEWLSAVNWDMHISPDDTQGFVLWHKHWDCWQADKLSVCTEPLQFAGARSETLAQSSTYKHRSSFYPFMPSHNDKTISKIAKDNPGSQWLMSKPVQVPLPQARIESFTPSVPATSPNTPEWYISMGSQVCPGSEPPSYITGSGPMQILGISQPAIPSNYYPHYVLQYNPSGWESSGIRCSCTYCIVQYESFPRVPHLQPQSAVG